MKKITGTLLTLAALGLVLVALAPVVQHATDGAIDGVAAARPARPALLLAAGCSARLRWLRLRRCPLRLRWPVRLLGRWVRLRFAPAPAPAPTVRLPPRRCRRAVAPPLLGAARPVLDLLYPARFR